jgi:hypothetical protein
MGLSSSGSKKVADGATATRETPCWTLTGVLTTRAPAARANRAEINERKKRMPLDVLIFEKPLAPSDLI